jgi:prepilin-type N-terminal cleavage/methylation domain-containing protein/prepilin-type processing-associated H-X9-DG protein
MPVPCSSMPRPRPRRAGFTLIELVVVAFLIGLLVAVLLPAVQAARETSRRLQCLSNLKQIGLALHHYESANRLFPAIYSDSGLTLSDGRIRSYAAHAYSPLVRMLSELDQGPLYNAVNLTLGHADAGAVLANLSVLTVPVGIFVCPSDDVSPVEGFGRVNYRFNTGLTTWISPREGTADCSGAFTMHFFYRATDFPDGLSNTIGASERLQGDWMAEGFKRGGDYLLADFGMGTIGPGNGAAELARCLSLAPTFPAESRGGESWFFSGFHFTKYNHVMTPNPRNYDCSFDNALEGIHSRTVHSGSFAATSHHRGGVNAMFMDGSVRFQMDGVAAEVWGALSTRDGNETIPSSPE